ncbi:hypothetical protein [Xenorhabdus sp. IM139775]|uniref:hypothetical protein n=1 Tax=Xenorhabdus sp. IM139775 TaxID=3025876 RepID=UPI00235989FF|nr:hypothetical protein [Xenorhabdus sp. IM139775]MDC9592520.1 hypothetical protein [Xenorhabdus sp. IM139775]
MKNSQDNDQSGTWHGLTVLRIKLRQVSNEAGIFANGRNRVIVDVYIQGTDSDNNQVLVPSKILLQHTWLIDYDTGEKLSWQAAESSNFTWAYTDELMNLLQRQEFHLLLIMRKMAIINSVK